MCWLRVCCCCVVGVLCVCRWMVRSGSYVFVAWLVGVGLVVVGGGSAFRACHVCVGRVVVLCWSCVGCVLVSCWLCVGFVFVACWLCVGWPMVVRWCWFGGCCSRIFCAAIGFVCVLLALECRMSDVHVCGWWFGRRFLCGS